MTVPLILHLETATNICSVALSKGDNMLAIRESSEDRSHGSLLTLFVDEVLKEAGIQPRDLDAIAVSKGPGSYTGLRIGVSAAKGFAYAASIPVIGVITLQAMAIAALNNETVKAMINRHPDLLLCPLIDARRMEVFTAFYDSSCELHTPVTATIIDENSFQTILESTPVVFFGNGSDKIKGVINHPNAHFIQDIQPSSKFMIPIVIDQFNKKVFENTAYFEPYYLKDFVATIPKKKVI
jgi:tRNA threonylcarbamoyladenosine biosynthesis protein TsaB